MMLLVDLQRNGILNRLQIQLYKQLEATRELPRFRRLDSYAATHNIIAARQNLSQPSDKLHKYEKTLKIIFGSLRREGRSWELIRVISRILTRLVFELGVCKGSLFLYA